MQAMDQTNSVDVFHLIGTNRGTSPIHYRGRTTESRQSAAGEWPMQHPFAIYLLGTAQGSAKVALYAAAGDRCLAPQAVVWPRALRRITWGG
jgi:hypothetical protein